MMRAKPFGHPSNSHYDHYDYYDHSHDDGDRGDDDDDDDNGDYDDDYYYVQLLQQPPFLCNMTIISATIEGLGLVQTP